MMQKEYNESTTCLIVIIALLFVIIWRNTKDNKIKFNNSISEVHSKAVLRLDSIVKHTYYVTLINNCN